MLNPRVRELERQATETVKCGLNGTSTIESFNRKKFAELLITELSDKVSRMVTMDKGYIPQDPHSVGWNAAVEYASRELKRYYGVEE